MYLGIFLTGGLFLSLGCFASALSRSQMAAAMISFVLGVSLFSLAFWPRRMPRDGALADAGAVVFQTCSTRCTISRAAWWTRGR